MTVEVAIKGLPQHIQDLYVDADPESTVSVNKYRQQVRNSKSHFFNKVGKVSSTIPPLVM
jgi:hypothetical protein